MAFNDENLAQVFLNQKYQLFQQLVMKQIQQ